MWLKNEGGSSIPLGSCLCIVRCQTPCIDVPWPSPKPDAEVMEGFVADEEGDLGEIGGDPDVNMEQDHGDPANEAVDGQKSKAKKHCICAAS